VESAKAASSPRAQAPSYGSWRSHVANAMAQIAPKSWATMKPGRSIGRMPENVLVNERAIGTAGLATDVDAVNPREPDASQDRDDKSECRHPFGAP
jgi:hypothetical protein